ncbi:MAG: hypothetical protein OEX01_05055 [Candidatus Bathyarchaeota archaeon]|nr:hypothetical protein [Candidatus Bathyarchaeota archaeon]
MTKTSVNLQPSYDTKSLAGKLARVIIYAFIPFFVVLGILVLVRGFSVSTALSSMEVLAGSICLGCSIILPITVHRRLRKSKEMCIEFVNSISDLIKHWAIVCIGPLAYQAYCELFDDFFLEVTPTTSNMLSFTIYKFLSPTQNVMKTPLWSTGKPDKKILPYRFLPFITVPQKTKDFQKWKQQPEKWKRTIAEDEELRELILTYSHITYLQERLSPSKGVFSIHVAGYDTYFVHPLYRGQSVHGKSVGASITFYTVKTPLEKFETPQKFNEQLINIGKKILNHIVQGIET